MMFHVEQSAGTFVPNIDPDFRIMTICRKNGLQLSETRFDLLRRYVTRLIEWNSKVNLISRRDEENIWFSHILHSLSPLFYLHFPDGARVLDLGSGGGFPGIPLAIARPDLTMVLLDSMRKKTVVLEDLVRLLGLTGTSVLHGRAEDVAAVIDKKFDFVVSRAVARLNDLMRWSQLLVRRPHRSENQTLCTNRRPLIGPALVALKGGDLDEEIAQAKLAGGDSTITVIKITFDGSAHLGLVNKKIVIVDF